MRFTETMSGTWQRSGSEEMLPMTFTVRVETSGRMRAFGTVAGKLDGTISVEGLASDAVAKGSIEMSPIEHRRIRYLLDFDGHDGRAYHFDGWKSIDWLHARKSWTTLPGTITDASGDVVGVATLYFAVGDLPKFLTSMRPAQRRVSRGSELERRRWHGEPGRLEVWYQTFNDPSTGAGFWLHHEVVSPTSGEPAEGRGWVAVFPAVGAPVWERFGPDPVSPGEYFGAGDVAVDPGRLVGKASDISWDLAIENRAAPIYTFSRLAWKREVLPAAQIVSAPAARFSGRVATPEVTYELSGAPGACARIYGHGNAERWAWLHADLGDGDVLEIVAAVGRRRGLKSLRPLPLVQLRLAGRDWPRTPLVAASKFRADIALPEWKVKGSFGDRRIEVTVRLPEDRCVTIPYSDPDGSTATCVNSERADAVVETWRRQDKAWVAERRWELAGTAHAEVGSRP